MILIPPVVHVGVILCTSGGSSPMASHQLHVPSHGFERKTKIQVDGCDIGLVGASSSTHNCDVSQRFVVVHHGGGGRSAKVGAVVFGGNAVKVAHFNPRFGGYLVVRFVHTELDIGYCV